MVHLDVAEREFRISKAFTQLEVDEMSDRDEPALRARAPLSPAVLHRAFLSLQHVWVRVREYA